ncbi:ABC transporter ATP-binding protein [Nannocystis sp. SCPEA4]|uniref:ATP-binding cassette domain-containing protein n=1 Tax=Nannocystis sp. SCPEA4 TaxID=2996787 RepID=UPI00226F0239|nr:ABC transporter ATP-binding protein [Nannocystis sp. SCPEA4]MCY1059396.1 ABC transporter ATP-binding protein [Nannocystis sp. SCPEA4]
MSSSPLRALLRRAFSPEELRRLVAEFPEGDDEFRAQIPGAGASLDALIDATIDGLDRRGLLGGPFLLHLAVARPNLAADIAEVAGQLGEQVPTAVEVAALLSKRRDAEAARKLAEIERGSVGASTDRRDLNLAVASLSRWHREASVTSPELQARRRDVIERRITSLAATLTSCSEAAPIEEGAAPHPDALVLRDEVESYVRQADGRRAVLRLLDLAERFGADAATHHQAIMLSAQVQSWHSSRRHRLHLEPGERREWIELLQSILDLTDVIVGTTTARREELPRVGFSIAPTAGSEDAPLLQCASVSKRYGRHGPLVLNDVSLTVAPRMIVGVIGPNGAGKSTLLRILAGELRATGGTLSYPQLQAAGAAEYVDWLAIRSQIAFVPQRLPFWRGRVADNLHAWATACGLRGSENVDIVDFYLERLGLTRSRNAHLGELSLGFQTRFALARALVGRPRLLLLDEPLAALDIRSQQRFLQDLRDIVSSGSLRQGAVISSQQIPEVEAIADDMLGLRDGGSVWFHGGSGELEKVRSSSLFEIGGQLDAPTRDRLTARFGPGCLRRREGVTLLRVDRDVSRKLVLELLCADDSPPRFFRDISASLERMFWEERP